jgi:hypothetical protein
MSMGGSGLRRGMTAQVLIAIGNDEGEPEGNRLLDSLVAARDLDELLRSLATVSAEIADVRDLGRDDVGYQESLALRLNEGNALPEELSKAIASGCVVTSTEQIANLAIYAATLRRDGVIARPSSMLRLLGVFNSCSLRGPTGRYYIDPKSVAAAFAVSTSHVDRFINVTHRYREFVRWADEHQGENGIQIRESIIKSTGLSYEDWARCIVAINGVFAPKDVGINGVPSLEKARIHEGSDALRTWLASRTITLQTAGELTGGDVFGELRSKGFYVAFARPLLDLGDRYYLLNPRGLDNALGLGIFFAALDGGNDPQDFFAFAGHFFEEYATAIVRRLGDKAGSYWHGEVPDECGAMSSDCFLLEGRNLLFFEMRFGRVARPVVERLDANLIDRSFADIVYAKIDQLDRNINRFARGDLIIPGIARENVSRLYPVIVLPSPFPRSPPVQRKIDEYIDTHDLLSGRVLDFDVAPLEIIEAETLEGLEGISDPIFLSDFIDRKVADPETRFTFFKNFLIERLGLTLKLRRDYEEQTTAWLRDLRSSVEGWIR